MPSFRFIAASSAIALSICAGLWIAGNASNPDRRDQSSSSATTEGLINDKEAITGGVRPPLRNSESRPRTSTEARHRDFSELTRAEKAHNLSGRLASLRDDLLAAGDPAATLTEIVKNLESLDSLGKRAFDAALENELAKLNADEPEKLAKLAEIYPKIRTVLKNHSWDGSTLEDRMFRVLIFKATDNGVDPLAEAGKVKATSTRAALEKGLLSQMIITSGDSYQEAVGKLSKPDQNEVYQKVMEGAPKEKVYRVESLGLYLNGAGKDGLNQSVPEQLLNDKAWFWKDSDAISQSIASSPPSQRRDFVIEKIVGIIGQGDREAALTWIALMQDKNKAASLRKKIIK